MTGETGVTLKVEGVQQLVASLNKAGADLRDLREVHAEVGRIVARAAEARAPRRSGALAGSIRATRQAKRARVVMGRASIPYGGPIHWGWPSRHIKPNPFISEAAQATEGEWAAAYRRGVVAALSHVKGA